MPKKIPIPETGDTIGNWRIVARHTDYLRADKTPSPQFRAQCVRCNAELVLKVWELERRNCVHCLRPEGNAQRFPAAEVTARIQAAYLVHRQICLSLRIAPTAWEQFERELRDDPASLFEEPQPTRTAADYEQRNYEPLYGG